MRIIINIVVIIMSFSCVSMNAQVKNIDKPLKGHWNFKPQIEWTIDSAGDHPFTIIDALAFSDNGVLYIMDRKLYKVFICDNTGKLLVEFGQKGSGPGEFSTLRGLFPMNDKLVVVDDLNIHYFSRKGEYKASIPNRYLDTSPVSFIDLDRFISATVFAGANDGGKMGAVAIHDFKNKTVKELFRFPKYKKGSVKVVTKKGEVYHTTVYSYSASNLTPGMVLHYDENKLYYGMNDKYKINVSDTHGNVKFHFTLDRERKKIDLEYKEKIAKRFEFPGEIRKKVVKQLPDYLNYFEKILVDKRGLIYVFATGSGKPNVQKIDIFSSRGAYLYSSNVEIKNVSTIKNIYFDNVNGGFMYLIMSDEDGNTLLSKAAVSMPEI